MRRLIGARNSIQALPQASLKRFLVQIPSAFMTLAMTFALTLAGPSTAFGRTVQVTKGTTSGPDKAWPEVASLVEKQKIAEAIGKLEAILAKTRKDGDEQTSVKAFVRIQQLRIGLHQYETVVKEMRALTPPKNELLRLRTSVFYAQALFSYYDAYQFEINSREKVDGSGENGSKEKSVANDTIRTWTKEEINVEILKSLSEPWAMRESLGKTAISDYSDFIVKNNYPAGTRDSMRDFISYLLFDVLVNTTLWSPTEVSEKYKADPFKLATSSGSNAPAKVLTEKSHPLTKASAVMRDLENWHLSSGKADGAMAARSTLFKSFYENLENASDQNKLVKWFTDYLEQNRTISWWTMGMASLAEIAQGSGDLLKAHSLTKACQKRFPDSIGAKTCAAIQKEIERPSFDFAAMKIDSANQRSIQINHRNLNTIYFRAWPIDVQKELKLNNQDPSIVSRKRQEQLLRETPLIEWSANLPDTTDFRSHRTFVVPPLKQTLPGAWVISASAKKDFSLDSNSIRSTLHVVSDLVILKRNQTDLELHSTGKSNPTSGISAIVVSGRNGSPRKAVTVDFYSYNWNTGHKLIESTTTNGQGEVTFQKPVGRGGSYFMIASSDYSTDPDAKTAANPRKIRDISPDPDALYIYDVRKQEKDQKHLIYTDRSVYRPAQTIHWKVLAYEEDGADAKISVAGKKQLTVQLLDSNYEKVLEQKITTNSFGTAAGTFAIPSGRILGQWTIKVNERSQSSIRVEEYKRPTFEVELKNPVGIIRLNKVAEITGDARFYFGQPVSEGTVKWTVKRTSLFPWWWDYLYDWDLGPSNSRFNDRGNQIAASGTSTLNGDGSFTIKFTPEADPFLEGDLSVFYNYEVNVDVTDSGGETRSNSRNYKVGNSTIEASIQLTSAGSPGVLVFLANESDVAAEKPDEKNTGKAGATILRSSVNGTPSPGKGSWEIFPLDQPQEASMPAADEVSLPEQQRKGIVTPGDRKFPRWTSYPDLARRLARWDDKSQKHIKSGVAEHDKQGIANVSLKGLTPGPYRIRYETKDDFGQKVTAWKEFVIVGEKTPLNIPLVLGTSSNTAKVGETIKISLGSSIKSQKIIFEKFRGGSLVSRETVDSTSISLRSLKITDADRGGFSLIATLVNDHQVARGSAFITVPWDNKELDVSFSSFRDKLTPGASETWTVNVKGKGKGDTGGDITAKSAEVLAFMYDRSLDLFGVNTPPSPLSLFPTRYSNHPWTTNIGQSPVNYFGRGTMGGPPLARPVLVGDQIISVDGYGIGGFGTRGQYGRGNRSFGGKMRSMNLGGQAPAEMAAMEDAESNSEGQEAPLPKALAKRSMPEKEQREVKTESTSTLSSGAPQQQQVQPRKNFSETAFWMPQLLTDKSGNVSIQFQLPDSVTSWKVYAQAMTQDLRSGYAEKQAQSVKDLMVRPYLPRFLREGDHALIKIVINNAGDSPLSGKLLATVIDTDTEKDVTAEFKMDSAPQKFLAPKGGSTTLSLPIVAPKSLKNIAIRITAIAGDLSDGELRPLPILPSKIRLLQSRFVTLKDQEQRTIHFDREAIKNPTTDQVVIGIDGQLFETVIKALPSLIQYPYECTDTILYRYLATAITDRIYKKYPTVASAAADFAKKRTTQLDPWKLEDPNRLMSLEETPWLMDAKGGNDEKKGDAMHNMLQPEAVSSLRRKSLEQLRNLQTSSGGFPWFPGGPPSLFTTLTVVDGLARSAEFGASIPDDMAARAWTYLGQYFHDELEPALGSNKVCCIEVLTYLNYLATAFPRPEIVAPAITPEMSKKMLEYSFKHWRSVSPRVKAYLIMTLHRANRASDARTVLDSVMDSAKTEKDRGTWWAAEERSWLWYNDTIESHALALRTILDVMPDHPKRDGLITWLMLNKKLNQWKSTRSTAEVIFSLARSFENDKVIGQSENFQIETGAGKQSITFDPKKYEGLKQVKLNGPLAEKAAAGPITITKSSKGLAFASATWLFATDSPVTKGDSDFFGVERKYFRRIVKGAEHVLQPLKVGEKLEVGDEIEVQLSITSKHEAEYVHLRDPRAAGFEPVSLTSRYNSRQGIGWYEEIRDSGTNYFFESIPVGEFTFKYRLRAATAGTYAAGPATIQSMYAPEFAAYSAGASLDIK